MFAEYIDEIIMFCAGAYFTGVGFGYLSPPVANPLAEERWLKRFGTMFKILGPIMIICAIVLSAGTLASPEAAK